MKKFIGDSKKPGLFHARMIDASEIAHMSVNALARHEYTNYDKLLYNGSTIGEARTRVRRLIDSKLREWSGQREIASDKDKVGQEISMDRAANVVKAQAPIKKFVYAGMSMTIGVKGSKPPKFHILKPIKSR